MKLTGEQKDELRGAIQRAESEVVFAFIEALPAEVIEKIVEVPATPKNPMDVVDPGV